MGNDSDVEMSFLELMRWYLSNLKLVRHLSESPLAQLANHLWDVDVPFVLANGDIKAGQPIEPITLYLTFNFSPSKTPDPVGMPLVDDAINRAKEAMNTISNSNTWEGALERIKWVMDTVSPVVGVCYNVLSPILG